jgi:hypothetical protein
LKPDGGDVQTAHELARSIGIRGPGRSDPAQVLCDRRRSSIHCDVVRVVGAEAVPNQDPLDGVAADLMAEVTQRPDQPRVPPRRVRGRHPDDQLFHLDGDGRTPEPAARRAVVLAGDQLAVPAQDRVRRDQARKLAEPATTDDPALDRQASPLVVGEAQPPSAELLAEDAVLLA